MAMALNKFAGIPPSPKVAAVVITYHPDLEVIRNLEALCEEVAHVLVVDNGSGQAALELLRSLNDIELIENGSNLGIATALNIGVRHALTLGMDWVFLFDQDSRVQPGFAQAMLAGYATSGWGARLGLLVPRYVDSRLHTDLPQDRVAEGLETTITSGTLLHAQTLQAHGVFAEELFIDGVDSEYSLRLRQAGLVLEECHEAVLLHSPGDPIVTNFRGRKLFQTANYSPTRRYYQERNKVWVIRRYWRIFPRFCLKLAGYSAKDFLKLLLVEEDGRTKLRYFFRGLRDGVLGRMGPMKPTGASS